MEQRRFTLLLATVITLTVTAISCNKDDCDPPESNAAGQVEICITGDFNDFVTKAEIENIFRMTWATNDNVYVYGKASKAEVFSCLGTLVASPDAESGNRVADLKGTIIKPAEDSKLTLVYSPLLDASPAVSDGAISIDLSSQGGKAESVVFVAYTAVDYSGNESSTYRSSFSFATSVLRVNATGLLANLELTKASLGNIETECKINFSDNASPAVVGENSTGTIARTFTNCQANSKGCAAFYIAVPSITANPDRSLSVLQIENEFGAIGFATGSKGAGNMMNSIAQMKIDPSSIENNTTNSDNEDLNI